MCPPGSPALLHLAIVSVIARHEAGRQSPAFARRRPIADKARHAGSTAGAKARAVCAVARAKPH